MTVELPIVEEEQQSGKRLPEIFAFLLRANATGNAD